MWNYYANQGTGFCVGYDSLLLFPHMRRGAKVHYYKTLPEISMSDGIDEQIWAQIFCKELSWEFEQEYRTYIYNGKGLNEAERSLVVEKECIKQVIFGYAMVDADKHKIMNVCRTTGLTPQFFQAHLNNGTVELLPIAIH